MRSKVIISLFCLLLLSCGKVTKKTKEKQSRKYSVTTEDIYEIKELSLRLAFSDYISKNNLNFIGFGSSDSKHNFGSIGFKNDLIDPPDDFIDRLSDLNIKFKKVSLLKVNGELPSKFKKVKGMRPKLWYVHIEKVISDTKVLTYIAISPDGCGFSKTLHKKNGKWEVLCTP